MKEWGWNQGMDEKEEKNIWRKRKKEYICRPIKKNY
jgi:hypothetical protein